MQRLLYLCSLLVLSSGLMAQPIPEPPRMGMLVQSGFSLYFQENPNGPYSGFQIYTARLRLQGRLHPPLSYTLQTDFTRRNILLDARIVYHLQPRVAISLGQFKAPFSAEALTSAARLDFISRARIVSQQAPGRQVGMQIAFQSPQRRFQWTSGIFNGEGRLPSGNADAQMLYVSRLESRWLPKGPLRIGLNGALLGTKDSQLGIDVRLQQPRWFISTEWIQTHASSRRRSAGFHISGGLHLTRALQALVRWDALRPTGNTRDDMLVLGVNGGTSRRFFFQANYYIPLRAAGFNRHYILTKLQVNI